jgi:hypothetical protein
MIDDLNRRIGLVLLFTLGITTVIFVTMLLFNITDYGITIASFGATAFMVLSRNKISKRRIMASYFLATVVGFIFSKFPTSSLNAALAAVTSFILMTLFSAQHAPALAMSVAVMLNKFSFWTDLLIVLCIFFIIFMAYILKAFWKHPERVLSFVQIESEKIRWDF